ncbi:MAG: alanine--tRNA ligase [Proteobacteria bacterium]|nr:alanine--tRNA ligase [Pseudomonadota bacterium]MCP4921032.1 alanine--tRNA ligase [Pseudomonadota bacterium]
MKTAEIRRRFLQYFVDRGHTQLPSSSVIPENDPTLFFVNAGMVQFKDIFTGDEVRSVPRATTVQKCLRVSGKHNDLDLVGRTARHHTFFEMLGNFSFGDYFKEDAIPMAWELLTGSEESGCFGLDPNRLWITIFTDDDEAHELWTKKVGVPAERVQRLGVKDNFWSMGDTGPCGPCSEIHWDHGAHIDPNPGGPATESDRYVEIWNNVFMQFDQAADGTRTNLPSPSIDTGMGLERLAAIKQGVYWNYDTDVFQEIIKTTSTLAGKAYGGTGSEDDVAMRVIADHARASAFLVADGVMPGNTEREYVLRRIMRRAIRYGVKLGLKGPFLNEASATVIREMGEAYPELRERETFVLDVIRGEEERFGQTLEKGLALLDGELGKAEGTLDGDVVFKLYDTFGFPPDLTRLIASERNVGIDEAGYTAAMEDQKAKGRAAWKGSGDAGLTEVQTALSSELEATEFTGYDQDAGTGIVLALVQDGARVDTASPGPVEVFLTATPFYAESGGQVGDHGRISLGDGVIDVADVQKRKGDLFAHVGTVVEGGISVGDKVNLSVAGGRRDQTRLNHSATHLLHAALKEILGDHVQQKGSLVDPDRLRFDFSHHKALTRQELEQIEDRVYGQILANDEVETSVQGIEEAKANGAMALFGEKYGDRVRVVEMGEFSTELCGGTHARRTGDIGLFRITSESGVAAGVRRIEGLTGPGAMAWARARDNAAQSASDALRTPIDELPQALERLLGERKRLEKELDSAKRELARASAGDLTEHAREIDGIQVLAAEFQGDASSMRDEADRLRQQLGTALVVLGSRADGKVVIIAAATKDIAGKRVHAGKIVGAVAKQVGGGGGGRPDMAQAGGRNADALPAALESVYGMV